MKINTMLILPLLFFVITGYAYTAKGAPSVQPKKGTGQTKWIIGPGRIGPLIPGMRIPPSFLKDTLYLHRNYFAAYIADGILFEGFKLKNPPVQVSLKSGPLHDREKTKSMSQPLSMMTRSRAVRYARKGAAIDMLVIESKKIRTAQGIGVGSRLAELRKAYPGLKISAVPPTFGHDRCSVWTPELKDVYFYFTNCKKAEKGSRVIRIMIFKH